MYIASVEYFLLAYGYKRGLTVMHRMRTWYNHKSRVAASHGNEAQSDKFHHMANTMSARIEEWPAARHWNGA